jgi:adenylate cyclase
VGQWPWRRDVIARLVTRLRDASPAVVALDIIFAESDRHGQVAEAEDLVESTIQTAETKPDQALARTLAEGGVILGYGLTFDPQSSPDRPCLLHPLGLAIVQASDEPGRQPFFQATGAVCNLPALAQAAGSSGFLNAAPDADGILRRAPLLAELDGRVYPGIALAAVAAATGARSIALQISNANAAILRIDDRSAPVDGKSNLLLRYRGKKRTFPYLSAADVLAGKAPADALRGKIVLVGTTALGTREVVATPLDTLFAGVEVQATIADNLLRQDFIYRPALGAPLDSAIVLVLGITIALCVSRTGVVSGLLGAGVTLDLRPVRLGVVSGNRRGGRNLGNDAREVHRGARTRR